MIMLLKLLMAHAIGDFAIRTEAMSKGKSRHYKADYAKYLPSGQKVVQVWFYYLTAHALVNSAAVWLATDDVRVALLELVLHWVIDFAKCEGWFNPHVDQFLHILCKVVYAVMLGAV